MFSVNLKKPVYFYSFDWFSSMYSSEIQDHEALGFATIINHLITKFPLDLIADLPARLLSSFVETVTSFTCMCGRQAALERSGKCTNNFICGSEVAWYWSICVCSLSRVRSIRDIPIGSTWTIQNILGIHFTPVGKRLTEPKPTV